MTKHTIVQTTTPMNNAGRRVPAIEIREAFTGRPLAIISHDKAAEILLKTLDQPA